MHFVDRFLDWVTELTHTRYPCGPTGDDMFCACGCGCDDSRCDYWIRCVKRGHPISKEHRCCR